MKFSKMIDWFRKYLSWIVLVLTLFICVGFICIYQYHFRNSSLSNNPSDWGVFGDYIGGIIGTVFTFGTIIIIILTLHSQNKAKNDTSFFFLLKLHDSNISCINGKINNDHFEGKTFYRKLLEECRVLHYIHGENEKKVDEILNEKKNLFNTYILNLNEIVKFIGYSKKYFFTDQSDTFKNLLIAQLSHDEKIILGYMCAFQVISKEEAFYQFYIKEKIHEKINYELHLASDKNRRPDAIKCILDKLDKA